MIGRSFDSLFSSSQDVKDFTEDSYDESVFVCASPAATEALVQDILSHKITACVFGRMCTNTLKKPVHDNRASVSESSVSFNHSYNQSYKGLIVGMKSISDKENINVQYVFMIILEVYP